MGTLATCHPSLLCPAHLAGHDVIPWRSNQQVEHLSPLFSQDDDPRLCLLQQLVPPTDILTDSTALKHVHNHVGPCRTILSSNTWSFRNSAKSILPLPRTWFTCTAEETFALCKWIHIMPWNDVYRRSAARGQMVIRPHPEAPWWSFWETC